jgi:hypothetical protein
MDIPSDIIEAAEAARAEAWAEVVRCVDNEFLEPDITGVIAPARERGLVEAVKAAIEGEENCWYDHHGYCQAHRLQPKGQCYVELGRAALAARREGAKR